MDCVYRGTMDVKCAAGVKKRVPEREATCTGMGSSGGAIMAEFGEVYVVQYVIGGEAGEAGSATRSEEKNDPGRSEV